jgi:hypothetical protein
LAELIVYRNPELALWVKIEYIEYFYIYIGKREAALCMNERPCTVRIKVYIIQNMEYIVEHWTVWVS